MKNILGLVIALSLGLVAALLNWTYLERKSTELETVEFLAIEQGQRVRPGDTFLNTHFTSVSIPKPQVGTLPKTAVEYADRNTVIGLKAQQRYDGGEIVLLQDLKTPPAELKLAKDERVMWIPVDTSTFVPGLVEPGDLVTFIVSRGSGPGARISPQPADQPGEIDPDTGLPTSNVKALQERQRVDAGDHELIGPFRILSLGNRLGSDESFRTIGAGRRSKGNVMGISVKVSGPAGQNLEPRAELLFQQMRKSNFRQLGVLLHPRE